jgi:hypothetical protein
MYRPVAMYTHPTSRFSQGAVLVGLLLPSACSRHAPTTFSTDSPASPDAVVAPNVDVTLALDGDPPMPGETSKWMGLQQPNTSAHDHEGHGGHAGHHHMPANEEGATDEPR